MPTPGATPGFSFFSFTYSKSESDVNQYRFLYEYTRSNNSEIFINAYINSVRYAFQELPADGPETTSNSIYVLESTYPQVFLQGLAITANMDSDEGFTTLEDKTGIFQRETDSRNISLLSNVKYVTIVSDSSQIKSVILPPIGRYNFNEFTFKQYNASGTNYFSICPYMSNVSHPITTTQFVSTNANFEGVFDSKLLGKFSLYELTTNRYSVSFINNNIEWYRTNLYTNSLTIATGEAPAAGSLLTDSNNQILTYIYAPDKTLSSIKLSGSASQYKKFVFIKNFTGATTTFYIYPPTSGNIDNQTLPINEVPYIQIELNAQEQRTVGLFYNSVSNNYNILSSETGNNLSTDSNYPGEYVTLSNSVGVISNVDKNIRLQLPYQGLGFAQMNTIFFYGEVGTPRTLKLLTFQNNESNLFVIPSGTPTNIFLSNSGGSCSYTFATTYVDSSNISVSIPLYSFN
jgi:hypothetical protein